MGVHGSRGILIEFVKYGLGRREEVSLTPQAPELPEEGSEGTSGPDSLSSHRSSPSSWLHALGKHLYHFGHFPICKMESNVKQ